MNIESDRNASETAFGLQKLPVQNFTSFWFPWYPRSP